MTPEQKARQIIDQKLEQAGWVLQDLKQLNLSAADGVAVREYPTDSVNRQAMGVIEAKRDEAGENLTVAETQTERYARGYLKWRKDNQPLPFLFVSQHVALIRPIQTSIGPFLHLFLTAFAGGRGQLDKEAYGAGKPGLNLQQVGAVTVPLPPSQEVAVILEAVVTQLSEAEKQGQFINHSIARSMAQRKSILKAAFSGQPVPQDPGDEPASVLLERIRAERLAKAQSTTDRAVRKRA